MVNVMEQLKTVKLAPKCERRINRGYLWIFSNEITDNLKKTRFTGLRKYRNLFLNEKFVKTSRDLVIQAVKTTR